MSQQRLFQNTHTATLTASIRPVIRPDLLIMGLITRTVTLTNFLIASSALGFQVFVLYPWHKDLDAGFDQLKKEHVRVLGAVGDGSSLIRDRKAVRSAKDSSQVKDAEPLRAASLYAKYAFAGAFCCSFTHAVLTPVDV